MQFFDTIELGQAVEVTGMREMRNGSLVVHARAARGGNVQDYLGVEVDKPEKQIVRVYRDVNEIFKKDSLKTFGHKAVTVNHPTAPVTPKTWKDVAAGHVGEEVLRDGEFVKIPMLLADQAAIDAVKGGKRELSVGYSCDLLWEAGITADGKEFDAKQVNVVCDHVAIVDRGRAGPDCRISDQSPSDAGKTMRALLNTADERVSDGNTQRTQPHHREMVSMKTLTIDGHSVALDDAAFIAVSTLQKQLGTLTADNLSLTASVNTLTADHAKALTAKDEAHAAALKVKDTELATKDAEIEKLKATQVDDAKLDALATARADVIGKAKALVADVKTDGIALGDIHRAVVVARLGDAAVADKSADYIEARFDLLADSLKGGTDALGRSTTIAPHTAPRLADGRTDPHAKRAQEMRDAWKQNPATVA